MDKAPQPTKIILRSHSAGGVKNTRVAGFLRAFNLDWSLKALKALLPSADTLSLNRPSVGDSDDIGLGVAPESPLTLPGKAAQEPVAGDYVSPALNLPVSIVPESGAAGSFQVPLTIPEAIVEEGPVRLAGTKPIPPSFQQARRQRYIYDW